MTPTMTELLGTLQPDGTLVLDEKPNLPAGRVRVVLESQTARAERFLAFIDRIRQRHAAIGHVPRSAEAIDAELEAERLEWEDHQLALEKLQQDAAAAREKRSC